MGSHAAANSRCENAACPRDQFQANLRYGATVITNSDIPRSVFTIERPAVFPDELHTDRLYLRRPVESDAERIFARYGQDPRVCRYMSWTPHRSIDDTRTFLATIISDNAVRSRSAYLILSRENDELLGSVGGVIQDMRMQFGYCLAYDAWGKGYATEAARAFVAAAIQEPPIWRIQAFCDVENPASARVLEKAGLTLEGTLRRYLVMPNLGPMPRDMSCYAKVRQ